MKKLWILVFLSSALTACSNKGSGKQEGRQQDASPVANTQDRSKKCNLSATDKSIGGAEIKIPYHAPAVRGKTIWGGLVPFNAVWVTGAHSAPAFSVNQEFQVDGKAIPAGKHAFFTIPGKDKGTLILTKNWNQHLADDYSEAEDKGRVTVKPQATEQGTERLKYEVEPTGSRGATINIRWEKIRVLFQMEINP